MIGYSTYCIKRCFEIIIFAFEKVDKLSVFEQQQTVLHNLTDWSVFHNRLTNLRMNKT